MRTALFAALVLLTGTAHAEADWFASLYTGDGVELRADERVFTLYALLNAMGFDEAPVARRDPVPKYEFHPVRTRVRGATRGLDPEVLEQADRFFDAHPHPLERYLSYAVQLTPPYSAAPKAKELAELKGFEGLLARVYGNWKLGELLAQVQTEYRKALIPYLAVLDQPLGKARKLLKVPDSSPAPLLVVNLLDAPGSARAVKGEAELVLVLGPSERPNVEGALRAYARSFIAPKIAAKAQQNWGGGSTLLREAQLSGASERTVGEYATELLSRALALRALEAGEPAYEAAARQGYFGLKELGRAFEDARPVEAWSLEALKLAEARRPAKK